MWEGETSRDIGAGYQGSKTDGEGGQDSRWGGQVVDGGRRAKPRHRNRLRGEQGVDVWTGEPMRAKVGLGHGDDEDGDGRSKAVWGRVEGH